MMAQPSRSLLAAALVLAACSAREVAPPRAPAPPPAKAMAAPPAAPPGHLLRGEVDRVLTTQGPPWVLRRVLSEEVIRRDGKFAGWRLVGLPQEWSAIDLRPGDIVTRVNGMSLETPDEAWEAWKSVGQAADLKITLTRDGAARQVVIPIDGAPVADTQKALTSGPGPQRAAAPPPPAPARRSVQLGGNAEGGDEEAY